MDDLIIKGIRDFFLSCPVLKPKSKLNVDFLGARPTEYTIDPTPADPIYKRYVDGGAIKQYVFVIASREMYGKDLAKHIDNAGFYEKLSSWIEAQDRLGNYPKIGKMVTGMETLSGGYLMSADEKSARYQVQIRVLYYD